MPRVRPKLFLEALRQDKLLVPLLPVCRTIERSKLELKWIQDELPSYKYQEALWYRSRHFPLQYILGTQPFGNLEILCEPGVLIPRNDTEEWCFELIQMLKEHHHHLRILDMCTGTGCIPLLMASELQDVDVIGVDISNKAINLALRNLEHNKYQLQNGVNFYQGNLFDKEICSKIDIDLVISNPPYIPSQEFNIKHGMEKSVRFFEPRLALQGDTEIFDSLIDNVVLKSNCQGFIFELAGKRQAEHVMQKFKFLQGWEIGYRIDSNDQFRNVIGWKSSMNFLQKICTSSF